MAEISAKRQVPTDMPTCLARYTTVADKLYFGDGKHRFYMERCCGAACEGTVCIKCSIKNQVKTQDVRTFDHGFVGEAYPAKSQLFDSPYYHAGVLKFGAPTQEDLERAMEAKRKAQGGTATATVTTATPVAPVPKPRGRPKSSAKALSEAVPEASNDVTSRTKVLAENKPKKEAKPKKEVVPKPKQTNKAEVVIAKPQEAAIVHILPQEGMVETMDEPLVVREVIRIVLKPFTHGSTKYWRDSDREKLYSCTKDGKRGSYVGRWDSVNQCIVKDAYDSDED